MSKAPYISIVIPAYNEETNIRLGALDRVFHYLERQRYVWEVLVVDDGSTDKTYALIEDFVKETPGFHLIGNPHQGKAATVIRGILEAKGEIVLFTDLDQATPLDQVEKIFPWFSRGYDVVIGSRAGRREGAPLWRRVMARGFMVLRSIFLGLHDISDTQCGFKAFRAPATKAIFNRLSLYGSPSSGSGSKVTAGFDIEVLYVAKKLGFKIKEVPVEWHYVETRRVNPLKDSLQGLWDIITIRINAWKGAYKEVKNSRLSS